MRELVGCVGVPIVGGRQTTAVGQHSSTQKCSGGGTAAAAQQYSASCTCMALPRMALSVPGSISSASDTSAGQAGSHATEMRQQVSWPVRQPYGETERPDPSSQPDRRAGIASKHSQATAAAAAAAAAPCLLTCAHHPLHDLAHFRVAQPRLGLTLKLRVGHLGERGGGQAGRPGRGDQE